MSDPVSSSLAALSKPVEKLIDAVSLGIGGLYKPIGTVRQAKADAQANIVLTQGDLVAQELRARAVQRLTYVEEQRQLNIESIVEKAKLALPETVSEEKVDKDWIAHFFTACGDVSNEDMQKLWAKILAGEVTEPGTTSRRVLDFLKTFSRQEAELFEVLMNVSFQMESGWNFIVCNEVVSAELHKTGKALEKHMVDIGILSAESRILQVTEADQRSFLYCGENFLFRNNAPSEHKGALGISLIFAIRSFTSIGQELSQLVTPKCNDQLVSDLSKSLSKEVGLSIVKAPPATP